MNKEKQEFQLGDIAYWMDEDYRWFESTVSRISLSTHNGKYFYETGDIDFNYEDIGKWVFKTSEERAIH